MDSGGSNTEHLNSEYMSRKGPVVGTRMLDFIEDNFVGVKSH